MFLSPDEPRSFGLGFPCQPRRRDETSAPGVEERAPIPGFRAPSAGRPGSPVRERGLVAPGPLFPAGRVLFSTQPRFLPLPSPSEDPPLWPFCPKVLCFSASLLDARRG